MAERGSGWRARGSTGARPEPSTRAWVRVNKSVVRSPMSATRERCVPPRKGITDCFGVAGDFVFKLCEPLDVYLGQEPPSDV